MVKTLKQPNALLKDEPEARKIFGTVRRMNAKLLRTKSDEEFDRVMQSFSEADQCTYWGVWEARTALKEEEANTLINCRRHGRQIGYLVCNHVIAEPTRKKTVGEGLITCELCAKISVDTVKPVCYACALDLGMIEGCASCGGPSQVN
jgi:hypothetical protein